MAGNTTVVLVATTDPDAVTECCSSLTERYRVQTTTDGDEALERLDDADVVLVDSDLRTESGTVVATEIDRLARPHATAVLRSADQEFESRHGTDIPGDRLVKPVNENDLRETVDRLARRVRYDALMDECATLAAKRGELESHAHANDSDEEYAAVQRRLAELFDELDEVVATFDGDDFRAAFTACNFAAGTGTQQVERFS
ncbi:HalX domain-containing protein [Natrinema sp. 74]|uniref:HalX domain-containing protein n=1 Tax=Natrinema sp. 74 TaxID=3384159 RepID=UPI0038D4014B